MKREQKIDKRKERKRVVGVKREQKIEKRKER